MIARGDAQPRMPVDDATIFSRNRYVGEQTTNQPGTDGDAAHRADDGFIAVDHIVDDVARLFPLPGPRGEIVDILLDDREIAAGREYRAGAGPDRGIDALIPVDIAPDVAELGMQCRIGRVHSAVLHCDAENLRMRAIEFEPRVTRIGIGHRDLSALAIIQFGRRVTGRLASARKVLL